MTNGLVNVERISSWVKVGTHCDTHNRSCGVLDTGVHMRLIAEDFVKWATML